VQAYTDQWFVGSRHVLRRNGERSAFSQLNQYAKPLKALADFRYARATTLNVDLIMTERSHGNEHFMTADYMTAELGARRSGSRCASIIPAKLPKGSRPLAELLVKACSAARDTLPASLDAFLADGSVPTSSFQPQPDGSQPGVNSSCCATASRSGRSQLRCWCGKGWQRCPPRRSWQPRGLLADRELTRPLRRQQLRVLGRRLARKLRAPLPSSSP
jgi:hypothetical protein